VSRALRYDVPGPDRRVGAEEIAEKGLDAIFPPQLPRPLRLVVDLGFGRGEFLQELARAAPEVAHLGVDLSFKRVLKMARRLARGELENVRIVQDRAEFLVEDRLPHASVGEFWINFPDPWPKKRHHRRRLIQPRFVHVLALRLVEGGVLNVATDHVAYAEQIGEVLAGEALLGNRYAPDPFRRSHTERVTTAYEREWQAQGRCLHYFSYERSRIGDAG
jgi:tRNA (guanine-N7-)-methyltransferase